MSPFFQKSTLAAQKPVSISIEERIRHAEDPFHTVAEVLQKQIREGSYDELIEALSDKTMLAGIAYKGSLCSGTWLARQVLGLGEYDKAITEALRSDQIVYIPTPPTVTLSWLKRLNPAPGSVIFDVGAGDGMTAAVIAFARPDCKVIAVECQKALAREAIKMVEANQIPNMEVRCALAESTDYSTGSVFYFYYPFFENTMDLVLNKIRKEVSGREISIVTLTVPDNTMRKHSDWLQKGSQTRDTENKFDHTRIFRSY